TFERDDCNVFQPANFSVEAGDIVQIEGANGAGKTTLMRLMTGALQPSAGSVRYRGRCIADCRYEYLANILYIGHQPGVKLTLSAEENLRWTSPATTSTAEISQALELVGLRGFTDVPCYSLSAGQHRRVALARLSTSKAKIWYLDEPFTSIDREGVQALQQQLEAHLQRGGAVVLSTHQNLPIDGLRKYNVKPNGHQGPQQ
ncbi:MAG: cytochrome c biogenesis heme-transporting ATPase CcmA, partial [Porticoccaceae bacterium]